MKKSISALLSFLCKAENIVISIVLVGIALFPTLEVIFRVFGSGIHGSSDYVYHLVLWIAFGGAMITSREEKHLAISALIDHVGPQTRRIAQSIKACLSVAICISLAISSRQLVQIGFGPEQKVGIFPIQAVLYIMPVAFGIMAIRFVTHAPKGIAYKLIALSGGLLTALFAFFLQDLMAYVIWPSAILLIIAAFFGTPIFVILGGMAVLLFYNSGGSIAVIPNEAYTMLTGPIIPTIPLFTLAGFILSESKAGERLVKMFNAAFGRLPGGLAIMAIIVCAFFTTFTGASGVTILALGGLLSYVLIEGGHSKKFTSGLLTASGSIGLLFPPSLPIILYGVVSHVNIKHMFIGGIIPGSLMVITLALLGIGNAAKRKSNYPSFNIKELISALIGAAGEIFLPILTIFLFFKGITTLVETGAIAVVYALILEVFIHRDIKLKEISSVFLKCIPLIGGVLIILAVANGLSYFIIDAEVPMSLAAWCKENIQSKYVFLILLNIALLITGCFMDIFSAIMVVVPLIIPLAEAYGIHPVHLGIIFLANLELGYLTPPVGLNLFLSSYRFNEPLIKIYKNVIPFLIALLVAVLLITYVPWLTTGLLDIFTL
ncbi:MAG: TRAP transporter large permease subunit [Chitinivibrionales bacterium]|nr:TRAP transporter large permease subunit [Chitinivibrionales bacterium]